MALHRLSPVTRGTASWPVTAAGGTSGSGTRHPRKRDMRRTTRDAWTGGCGSRTGGTGRRRFRRPRRLPRSHRPGHHGSGRPASGCPRQSACGWCGLWRCAAAAHSQASRAPCWRTSSWAMTTHTTPGTTRGQLAAAAGAWRGNTSVGDHDAGASVGSDASTRCACTGRGAYVSPSPCPGDAFTACEQEASACRGVAPH